jgi:putative peptidoglycan lipid II flippase
MGSTLGYGQTMEFQALNFSQPSQPIEQLRQERLQQLREERLRRQQRRMNPDVTRYIVKGQKQARTGMRLRLPGLHMSGAPTQQSPGPGSGPRLPSAQMSPRISLPSRPLSSTPAGTEVPAAAVPTQDTAAIQRVKIGRAAFLITSSFMLSSILSLLRTVLFSGIFGASTASDAFFQAYLIPNTLYTVVTGGALSSAFIPVFTKYSDALHDEKTAWHIASSALNLAVVLMIALASLAAIFAPALVPLYSPGVSANELHLIVTLTRIMMLQAIVLGSGVIVTSVLNAKQDFTLTAIGTVLYNVGMIIGLLPGLVLLLHSRASSANSSLAIYSATIGVVLGAILQIGVQVPGLFKVKMRYTLAFDWRHPAVRQIGRQMVPRIINSVMLSFSTSVDRNLLSLLTVLAAGTVLANGGLITIYLQAFAILQLAVLLFGSSASTAAFPALASYVARERFGRVRSIIMETLREILFLAIPSTVGLLILSLSVIQVILEHGHFTLQEARFTMVALDFFAIGLPGLAAVEILTRSFYAMNDSKTPVIVSVIQFIFKIVLSLALIDLAIFGVQWGMGMLAFSTAIASTLEAIALFILLYQRIGGFDLRGLRDFLGRMLVASLVMGVVVFMARLLLDTIINTTSSNTLSIGGALLALIKLLIEIGVGSVVFLLAARLLNIEERNTGLVRRVLNRLHITWL